MPTQFRVHSTGSRAGQTRFRPGFIEGQYGSTVMPAHIDVSLNGEPKSLPAQATIRDLLAELKLDPRYLAVEVNRRVVPRGQHAETALQPGDQIEIVTLVGGG